MAMAFVTATFAIGCGGSPPPPAEPVEEEPVATPTQREPVIDEGPALEEDAAPEGGAYCEATADCESGQQCRGPAGCQDDFACGAPRDCGEETVAYCGCDAATFYALENCPGRSYQHVGPCEALGETVEADPNAVEGNAICQSDADCRSGWVCAGQMGCGTFWTCVPRRRMRPRCTRSTGHFCSCDGVSFEGSSTCPGQPYQHPGYCPGDEPEVVAVAPTPTPAPRPRVTPTPTPRPAPTPPAEPTSCTSNRDCRHGEVCQGAEGCEGAWRCAPPTRECIADTQRFCSCDGLTFRASMTCPGRPHRHRGSCE